MASLDPWDRALLDAIDDQPGVELVSVPEMAERSGLSLALLEALAREGLIVPQEGGSYALADAETVRAGLELVEAGVPLGELLDLARKVHDALEPLAPQAVDLFARFVRDAVQGSAGSSDEAAARLVSAFRTMLPASERLVAHHFRRLLVAAARARLVTDAR